MRNALAKYRDRLGMPPMKNASLGMTLIEIIIVVALLATLMAVLVTNVIERSDTAKEDAAKIGMSKLAQGLQLYKVHNNRYPTTDQGLDALLNNPGGSKRWRGPYVAPGELNDPWGEQYEYESETGANFKIITNSSGKRLTYPEEAESGDES